MPMDLLFATRCKITYVLGIFHVVQVFPMVTWTLITTLNIYLTRNSCKHM